MSKISDYLSLCSYSQEARADLKLALDKVALLLEAQHALLLDRGCHTAGQGALVTPAAIQEAGHALKVSSYNVYLMGP